MLCTSSNVCFLTSSSNATRHSSRCVLATMEQCVCWYTASKYFIPYYCSYWS
jgi:hypothetical protein